jgi:ATP-dependent Zn protease
MAREDHVGTVEVRPSLPVGSLASSEDSKALARHWRRLTRVATFVAVLTSPASFAWLHVYNGWSIGWSLAVTFLVVIAFRGLVDVVFRRFIPWPSLFGEESMRAREGDVIDRRRAWFWRKRLRFAAIVLAIITIFYVVRLQKADPGEQVGWIDTATDGLGAVAGIFGNSALWLQGVFYFFLFVGNFMLFFGPMLLMGISQIRSYEPGDADWGVQLDNVRGQAEAKEEVRQVVNLWQSGEAFEKAGGKRERGLLLLGAPGTGKTMLSKAIATNFNAPFLSVPGSGFAQTFIGMDVLVVRYLAAKAKRLARKWGGQAIVFIDEIDAVGTRRRALTASRSAAAGPPSLHDFCFYGPMGALNPSEDLILETRAWRERLFAEREPARPSPYPPIVERVGGIVNQAFPGMFGGGGQLALNQLLVVMDGIGDPPFWRRFWTNRINTFLDACYFIPPALGKVRLRMPRPKPRTEQIFFIGATNAPIESLDPALIRPGRMGRHVWFRTPTKDDRLDIFNLYLAKVTHDPALDDEKRRDELARITNGYSPAMIEQICSMALTIAHHDQRDRFGWQDIVEATTTIESGSAVGVEYLAEETKAVAIHEAGHAAAAHVYMKGAESTRLSVKMRGPSLGHHQAFEKEERFNRWQSEELANLTWTLGAMAAERVFYGETSRGVGGDVQGATARAAWMVGAQAMGPERVELNGGFESDEEREAAREKIMKQFERVGKQIMRRTGGDPSHPDPIQGVLMDMDKRALAAQLLGQAYVRAHHLIEANRPAVEHIAEILVERREMYGDEVLELLDEAKLVLPEVDLTDEKKWPVV